MKTLLPKQKGNAHDLFSINATIAAHHYFLTYLFAALIAVDGFLCDSRPSTCGNNEETLKLSLKY